MDDVVNDAEAVADAEEVAIFKEAAEAEELDDEDWSAPIDDESPLSVLALRSLIID